MHITSAALRYFVVLAGELHFARAARLLRIGPPSLTQQISRLESQVGHPLFERSPQGVRLTPYGEELLPIARRAVKAHDEVVGWARTNASRVAPLRLGIVASGAGDLTSEIVAEALRRHPRLQLELMRLGFFDAQRALSEDAVDVAIVLGPVAAVEGVVATPIMREGRVLVLRDNHPLARRGSITVDETNNLKFIMPSAATGDVRAWWLVDPRPDGTRPTVAATADDVEGLMEFCAAGIGVNIATRSAATHFARTGLAYVDIVDIEPAEVILLRSAEPRHPGVLAVERVALDVALGQASTERRRDGATRHAAVFGSIEGAFVVGEGHQ